MGGVFIDNTNNYAILPLDLITNEKYKKLTSNEKLLYVLLLNRRKFSEKNRHKFSDENGVFVYYSNKQIRNHLNCSESTAMLALNNLQKAELICKGYQERGLPLKIYVNDIRLGNVSVNSSTEKLQDKLCDESYSNSNRKEKPYIAHSQGEEKQVSFDIERAKKIAYEGKLNFGEMKAKKRRTRNTGPTL